MARAGRCRTRGARSAGRPGPNRGPDRQVMAVGGYREEVVGLAAPLADAGDFDVLLDRVGAARVVMLGEASHGSHEFYRWRAALTQRLIDELGFSFVAGGGGRPGCDPGDPSGRGPGGAPTAPPTAPVPCDPW